MDVSLTLPQGQSVRPDKVNPFLLLSGNGNGALRRLAAVDGPYRVGSRREFGIKQRPGLLDGQGFLITLVGNDNRLSLGEVAPFYGIRDKEIVISRRGLKRIALL